MARKSKPWFDVSCFRRRKEALSALHLARTSGTEAILREYAEKKKKYKTTVKRAKDAFQIEQERKLIEEAAQDPFKALKPKNPRFPRDIAMETWTNHFTNILQMKETRPPEERSKSEEYIAVSISEVRNTIKALKNRKAAGPDQIFNEHLKEASPTLATSWAALLNECLRQGRIPERWRTSTIKLLYKGKGDISDPNAYRGIALECTLFKVLTSILVKRLAKLVDNKIPELQFGFRQGRSTIQAIQCLKDDIQEAKRMKKGKLHVIFIDYTKAFDRLNRTILINKLELMIGKDHYITRLVHDILCKNDIEIDDSITKSKLIKQTNGVLQDPLSRPVQHCHGRRGHDSEKRKLAHTKIRVVKVTIT